MEVENKNFKTRAAEFSQRIDIVTSGVALVGSVIGLIPIGITIAFLGFNTVTYVGAEAFKEKK